MFRGVRGIPGITVRAREHRHTSDEVGGCNLRYLDTASIVTIPDSTGGKNKLLSH